MKQTKTIPFDWEEYNNNREKYKIFTRDGDEVTQLTKFEITTDCTLVGILLNELKFFYINGKYLETREHGFDLFLHYEEDVVESWVNLYYNNDDGRISTSGSFLTKEDAKSIGICVKGYFKTINLNDLI